MGIPFDHPAITEAVRKGLLPADVLSQKPSCETERGAGNVRQKGRPAERCERSTGLTTTDPVSEGRAMADEQPTSTSAQNQSAQFRPDPSARLDEVPAACVVARATHLGEPVPKHRPRYSTKGGQVRVYTTKSTVAHQKNLAAAVASQLCGVRPDTAWAFGIRAVFYVGTHQRKDTDNMLKAVLDALNKKVFADDCQVKETMAWSVLDIANPRTEFVVYRMYPIDRAMGQCVRCGKEYRQYRSWKARRYCSRKCQLLATTTSQAVSCAECGKELVRQAGQVERNVHGKFYCSGACIGKHNRRQVACSHCGASISRPQSLTPESRTTFYCNMACRSAANTGKPLNISAEASRDRANRGWATRRAKKAALASGGDADRNGDASQGANFDGGPPVAG